MRRPNMSADEVFAHLERAAIAGERCPPSNWGGHNAPLVLLHSITMGALAKAGKIRIEVSGKNFRQVTILAGPHAGKKTAANPDRYARVWQTISAEGRVLSTTSMQERPTGPSAPRSIGRGARR